ncbi:hypothetical protein CPAR01_13431 [Colletotrichum paranaense]|uniref:Uncharacterized protein n=2 Tax=Colletotrichum acutatum species complex TaxID=2707335 RepID=A0AAI9UI05_9PEZI|nr:uncharacterized protein CPAR01_13431 [Colletotrichum paranaense]KAK1457695.1 hypothetical protein CMEL01_15678 [Colletotrichum melonis]KAK1526903.1 hypothetical protein CPAR01_13431 [Colletotrichum paranaense]
MRSGRQLRGTGDGSFESPSPVAASRTEELQVLLAVFPRAIPSLEFKRDKGIVRASAVLTNSQPKWLGGAQTAQRTSEAQRAGHLALRIMSGFAGSAEDQAKEPSVGDGAVGM